jgi:hypothetical protein
VHALKDAQFENKLKHFLAAGKPVLLTDGLARRLKGRLNLNRPHVHVLAVNGSPKSLLKLDEAALNKLRVLLLQPWQRTFRAPKRMGLYLFADGSWVIENFNDQPVSVELDGKQIEVKARGWRYQWKP